MAQIKAKDRSDLLNTEPSFARGSVDWKCVELGPVQDQDDVRIVFYAQHHGYHSRHILTPGEQVNLQQISLPAYPEYYPCAPQLEDEKGIDLILHNSATGSVMVFECKGMGAPTEGGEPYSRVPFFSVRRTNDDCGLYGDVYPLRPPTFVNEVVQDIRAEILDAKNDGDTEPTDHAFKLCRCFAAMISDFVPKSDTLRYAAFGGNEGGITLVIQSLTTDRRVEFRFPAEGKRLEVVTVDEKMHLERSSHDVAEFDLLTTKALWVIGPTSCSLPTISF